MAELQMSKPRIKVPWSEAKELPKQLRSQVVSMSKDEVEIMNVLEQRQIVSLSRLMVDLYDLTGKIHNRVRLSTRLWRMYRSNKIFKVPGRKGIYSLEQLGSKDLGGLV